MVSLLNGLSSLGAGVAAFAGTAGLEQQKAALAQQQTILADQLATTRETGLQKSAGDIAAAAQAKQNTFLGSQGDLNRQSAQTVAQTGASATLGAAGMSAGASKYASDTALQRTQLEVDKPTGELQMARALAGPNATQEQLNDALVTVLSGRAKFTFSPTTQVDPDDPGKVISGVNRQNTRTGDVDFLPTGTNPNKPGAGGALGNRAEVYFKRVTVAANEATAAAQNIMELPSGSDSGWFAGRGTPARGLLGAAKETLTNALTTQGVQDYNTMVPGIGRSLAAIETGGLAPSGTISSSMEGLILKAGDSEMTKMRKMAELRQIVEKGMEPNLVDPKIPDVQKAQVRDIITQIQTAIPFTHHDITVLQQSTNPSMTMADVVKARGIKGGGAPTAAAAPDAALPMPKTADDAVAGKIYNTGRGPARWDGNQFLPVQ